MNSSIHSSTPVSTNSDAAEIDKFSDLAHQWWDETGALRTLHHINPVRVAWIEKLAGGLSGKTVLDIGCGGGILSEALAKKGALSVLGIDLAEKSIRVAKLHALEAELSNLRYQCVAAEDLAAQSPASMDVIACMEMLEHVPHPEGIVRSCAQLLKPDGVAFFSTINRNAKAWLTAIVGAEYVLGLVPRGTHEYQKLIRPSELTAWSQAEGLQPFALRGLHYNPLTKRASETQDCSVNYLLAVRKRSVLKQQSI